MVELDSVVLMRSIPEYGLEKGDIGVVVHLYKDEAAEVEFLLGQGDTLGLVTLALSDLRTMKHDEILHVRGLHSA